MAASLPSNATPKMLAWARSTARLDIASVARAEKIDPQKLEAWERGEGTPTLSCLRRLANRYKRPLMVFYLVEPPKEFSVVKDFRFLPLNTDREFSPELALALRLAQERQAWASSFLEDNGFPAVDWVGSHNVRSNPITVAKSVVAKLGITPKKQSEASSDAQAFVMWRRAIERAGIFVFQAAKVSVPEMRGFALPDKFAPAVVVNARDSYKPKCFTLIHELAHVIIGETAVTGSTDREFLLNPNRRDERFCNLVAAEVLVPSDDFKNQVPSDWAKRDELVLDALSRRYWVSRDVILLRMVELKFASEDYMKSKQKMFVPANRRTGGPIPQFKKALARAGESFARVAIGAYRQGEIHGGELTSLLSMPLKHLTSLENAVFPNRVRNSAG